MKRQCGLTDIPCLTRADDKLETEKYIDGLENFITNCVTPMAVALQGDWGTGKTSFLNMLEQDFKEKKEIGTIYFNTWQYSQFNMADDLYFSFINSIIHTITADMKNKAAVEKMEDIIKILVKIAIDKFTKDKLGVEIVEKVFTEKNEKMLAIQNLKKAFEDLVNKALAEKKQKRIVIFIDDLDRLNPEIAVELLEVIKLFLDVEKCVFVMAIDYNVVVSGVRKKYGERLSDEKCRDFFAKIIQVPFGMPVKSYNIDPLIKDALLEIKSDKLIEIISGILKETVDNNPRVFKRLANSFQLMKSIQLKDKTNKNHIIKYNDTLLFLSLIMESYCPKLHSQMCGCDDVEALQKLLVFGDDILRDEEEKKSYLESNEWRETLNDDEWIRIRDSVKIINNTREKVEKSAQLEREAIDVLDCFHKALKLSSVISVDNNRQRRKAIKVNNIVVCGKECEVKTSTATDALRNTFNMILREKDVERVKKFVESDQRILTFDPGISKSFFRQKSKLYPIEGKMLYIGTSNCFEAKTMNVESLCKAMDMNKNSVIWKDGEVEVFRY